MAGDDPQAGADGPPPPDDAPVSPSGLAARLGGTPLEPSEAMPRWVPRAIMLFFVGVVGLAVARWLLGELKDLLITILIALFVSFAMEPAVNWLAARGWKRGWATGLVFVVFVVFSLLFLGALGKVVADEVVNLVDSAPGYLTDAEEWLNETFGLELSGDDLRDQLTDADGPVRSFATQAAGNALGISASVLGIVFQFFTVALFAFYLVADGPRFRRVICSFLRPDRQRQVLETWEIAIQKTGGYIYSRALLALLSGVAHWIAFEIIGVPYAIALAVFVGLVSQFVPVVGTYLAAALPAFIALVGSPFDAVLVVAFATFYQQIENYVFAPRISARTMDLHPAVAFGSVLAGIGILGGIGALLALPFSAVVQALGSTYIERHPVIDSDMTSEPAASGSGRSSLVLRYWRARRTRRAP
ncbi:AI-2E family transporter [Rhabdothermincola salaria]|uniref:AI-2E family transporter n=1 Tax=Rhabdothermincola salaria TaxID=2903142 RepID=UPI001E5B2196|nr:AI-2E family transporter [Rhabdothermincola salaria]MCD9623315.1 AI-2E family transporter [Rhabdothermincola salaria]